jgi:hypothetical protein
MAYFRRPAIGGPAAPAALGAGRGRYRTVWVAFDAIARVFGRLLPV